MSKNKSLLVQDLQKLEPLSQKLLGSVSDVKDRTRGVKEQQDDSKKKDAEIADLKEQIRLLEGQLDDQYSKRQQDNATIKTIIYDTHQFDPDEDEDEPIPNFIDPKEPETYTLAAPSSTFDFLRQPTTESLTVCFFQEIVDKN